MKKTRIYLALALLFVIVAVAAFQRFNVSLEQGLEEEKSYSRHAMEYHRNHPEKRKGDARLEMWSAADYIALSVQQHDSTGAWANWSDQLPYLSEDLKRFNGRPFCIIESPSQTVVLAFYVEDIPTHPRQCTPSEVKDSSIALVRSGDMESLEAERCMAYVLRRTKGSER